MLNPTKNLVVFLAVCVLFLSVSQAAKNRKWQDGRLLKIGTIENKNVFVAPIGGILVGGRLPDQVYCWVDLGDIVYTFVPKKSKPLNFTINGPIKVAIDGLKAYAIDDGGKEVEFKITGKVAKSPTPPPN